MPGIGKSAEMEHRLVVGWCEWRCVCMCTRARAQEWAVTANEYGVSSWSDKMF